MHILSPGYLTQHYAIIHKDCSLPICSPTYLESLFPQDTPKLKLMTAARSGLWQMGRSGDTPASPRGSALVMSPALVSRMSPGTGLQHSTCRDRLPLLCQTWVLPTWPLGHPPSLPACRRSGTLPSCRPPMLHSLVWGREGEWQLCAMADNAREWTYLATIIEQVTLKSLFAGDTWLCFFSTCVFFFLKDTAVCDWAMTIFLYLETLSQIYSRCHLVLGIPLWVGGGRPRHYCRRHQRPHRRGEVGRWDDTG